MVKYWHIGNPSFPGRRGFKNVRHTTASPLLYPFGRLHLRGFRSINKEYCRFPFFRLWNLLATKSDSEHHGAAVCQPLIENTLQANFHTKWSRYLKRKRELTEKSGVSGAISPEIEDSRSGHSRVSWLLQQGTERSQLQEKGSGTRQTGVLTSEGLHRTITQVDSRKRNTCRRPLSYAFGEKNEDEQLYDTTCSA